MTNEKKSVLRRCTDKLFGGLNMSWLTVILFALGAAILTTVFLVLPIFKNTSFERMGIYGEAWIFFAIIIMTNCKKPLESMLKTFVFFLISQPLIYLFQVPFSEMGWQIFGYYRTWFILTLLTLPMAFVGWYIIKNNWISLLILFPILVCLTLFYVNAFVFSFKHFPCQIVTALFCLIQVVLYLYAFTPKLWMRLVGFLVPLAIIVVYMLLTPRLDMHVSDSLPDNPVLTDKAVVVQKSDETAAVQVSQTGEDSMISVHAHDYGKTEFTIKDGKKKYRYSLEIYEDNAGHAQVRMKPVDN